MLSEAIIEPEIIMFGCRAITARPPVPGHCPSCGRGIRPGDDNCYCGLCDAASPRVEARVRSGRFAVVARERAARAAKQFRDRLEDLNKVELSEADRRRLWNGYKGGILAEAPGCTNTTKIARDWLTAIGQVPDWTKVLARRGGVPEA